MQLEEFMRLVDAYGGDAQRWPPDRRAAALTLAASDAAAGALLHEARILDRLLDAAPIQAPSVSLRTAVAGAALDRGRRPAAARRSGRRDHSGRLLPGRWAAAALAAACAAGVVTGVAAATRQAQPTHAAVSADPAVDAARLLGDPMDAEG
jgi:hypothetical protein